MKKLTILLLAVVSVALCGHDSHASWFIDPGKFHISAHGQTSCQDCHPNIADGLHPNPRDVSKGLIDFFSVDQCSACHEEVMDTLNEGFHGSEKVKKLEEYENCIQCHNPHYQLQIEKQQSDQPNPSQQPLKQCDVCHSHQSELPTLSDEDEVCMKCHRFSDSEETRPEENISVLCFHCHGQTGTKAQELTGERIPLIDKKAFDGTPHAKVDCMTCHPRAAEFNHHTQKNGDCRQCHSPHDEKTAHDAHAGVACQACHLESILPVRNFEFSKILWEKIRLPGATSRIHQMIQIEHTTACHRCHFRGNHVGAVSMILPPKSVLCMPCHAATFSVGDTTTLVALVVFFAGFVLAASVWLSGSLPGEANQTPAHKASALLDSAARNVFSRKIVLIIKTLFYDVLLQRRLYQRSAKRWVIHSLIFFPFVFRLLWGLMGLVASTWLPDWPIAGSMVNKNNPVTAFLFDLTGIMIALGILFAFLRGTMAREDQLPGLPEQDRWALSLIGGIVFVGFILEGMRIAMTGDPVNSGYALVGYGISRLFFGMTGMTDTYGYVWYFHAILTGVFFAYLPFSRLMHIIMAPVVLAMNAVSGHGNK